MRDFYDLYVLSLRYGKEIDAKTLTEAFTATCKKRSSDILLETGNNVIDTIKCDENLAALWAAYQKKFTYAAEISYEQSLANIEKLYRRICP